MVCSRMRGHSESTLVAMSDGRPPRAPTSAGFENISGGPDPSGTGMKKSVFAPELAFSSPWRDCTVYIKVAV